MIKFRAWGKNGNYPGTPSEKFEMFYDVSVVTTYKDKEQHVIADFGMYNESDYNGTEIIDYTLMQSTGLFDKNGKEIFEGDIVDYYKSFLAMIKKKDGCFVIKNSKNGYCDYSDNLYGEIESIGNIYENPELLESVEE